MSQNSISPVLVLSTGRCGSTMISEMLNLHPSILSLSEWFSFLVFKTFSNKNVDGAGFWELLSGQWKGLRALLSQEKVMKEIIYPFDSPNARFTRETVPAISATSLPHLTPDHDRLIDEIKAAVIDLPKDNLGNQFRYLFNWLSERFGCAVWVERSGGSLMYGPMLMRLFPEARVVHIFRDGRDTALSMHKHHAFNMTISARSKLLSLGIETLRHEPFDVYKPSRLEWIGRKVWSTYFRRTDFMKMLQGTHDLVSYGKLWSDMMLFGNAYLSPLPADRVLNLRFEDFTVKPHEELRKLVDFIDPGLDSDAWLAEAAKIPRVLPPRYKKLDASVREALTEACAPGLKSYGYDL